MSGTMRRRKPCQEAGRRLAEKWWNLAFKEAHRFCLRWKHMEASEVQGEALLALVQVAAWYDPARGIPFPPVAAKAIRRHLLQLAQRTELRKLPNVTQMLEQPELEIRDRGRQGCDTVDDRDTAQAILDRLPGKERSILEHLMAGKSIREIGELYGVSKQRVHQMLGRIRRIVHVQTRSPRP